MTNRIQYKYLLALFKLFPGWNHTGNWKCLFGNRCTCTNNFLSNYYALKINTGVLFPLFNIHLKYSLVILCIGIITDFMNKWKHSASSWLIFPSVSSPLQQVMYTFTDQYCDVIKQAHVYQNTHVLVYKYRRITSLNTIYSTWFKR